MALGDNYNGGDNNKKKYYEPTVNSPFGTSNTDGIDPSAISYQFSLGMLKISIAPMLPSAKPGDRQLWDHSNEVSVWLTHIKARLLLNEIEYVQAHPDTINNAGVNTGTDGLISFSNGKELGASGPCLIIRKIDPNTGEATSVYAYQFKTDYYKTVRNYDPHNPTSFERTNYPDFEIDVLKQILRDYSCSIGGAQAYANMYHQRFDTNKMNTKIKLIMEKLGIESPEYNRRNDSNKSFFNNQNVGKTASNSIPTNNGMRSTTMDELAEDIE